MKSIEGGFERREGENTMNVDGMEFDRSQLANYVEKQLNEKNFKGLPSHEVALLTDILNRRRDPGIKEKAGKIGSDLENIFSKVA